MFDANMYHVLDSLVPPSVDKGSLSQESPLRLDTICALVIARSECKCHLLSNTPMHLHKVLWTAYLKDEYYAKRDSIDLQANVSVGEIELFLDVLPELLYHWPHEKFVLSEIMPTFPPRPNRFSHFWGWGEDKEGPYGQNQDYLHLFYNYVTTAILRCCIDNNGKFPEQHNNYGIVRQIDVTGFCFFGFVEMASMTGITDPFYKNKDGKLEVTLDIGQLPCEDIKCVEHWFTHCYSKSTDYFVIKVGQVDIYDTYKKKEVTRIITKLVNDGAFSLSLRNVKGSVVIEKVFENANQKNILAVELSDCATSLYIMLYFINLIHLDLSNNNLRDQLDFLLHMHRGLLYLNLSDCNLKNEDLDKLTRSCHQSTLRELELTANVLDYDNNSDNLIRLCESLTNILKLNLDYCELESWPFKVIQSLLISFKMLPNIVYLNLHGNTFSTDIITTHIMILQENSSLRYLKLSLPPQITDIQLNNKNDLIKSFNSEINAKFNKIRSQLLYVEIDY